MVEWQAILGDRNPRASARTSDAQINLQAQYRETQRTPPALKSRRKAEPIGPGDLSDSATQHDHNLFHQGANATASTQLGEFAVPKGAHADLTSVLGICPDTYLHIENLTLYS